MTRYDLAYLVISPAAAAYVGYKYFAAGKYHSSLGPMLGRDLQEEDPETWRNGSIWVHAVSVGEVIGAKAMLPLLRKEFPELPILLTTHTETGQGQAKRMEGTLADGVRYFPFDFSWIVRRFLKVYQPKVFIAMETELWPNVLNIVSESGARIFVLNGKISERSFRSYSRVQSLLLKPLSRVNAFCVQTEADATRVRSLTKDARPVYVTGNCKFDTPIAEVSAEEAAALRQQYGIKQGQPVVVVGSTHPGEEEILLQAWRAVLASVPHAVMLLVPRHPERFAAVWTLLCDSGLAVLRASDMTMCGSGPASLVLIDKMGVLAKVYAIASIAIVAGSFVDGIGGHNLQEAAGQGVPVIYGPYMKKQPDMTRILTPQNGGTVANSAESLALAIIELLQYREQAVEKGARGRAAFQQNRGSAERNMEVIRRHMQ